MLPAVINFKLELLLPVVRSSDGQEEGEDEGEIHSLGICYCLWLSLWTRQAQRYGITTRDLKNKTKPTINQQTKQWGCF